MLTQLQLEGPELEPLLARVRNELGTSARIVHAEKIRSGGVAGFFARERFELTVEVDTEAHRAFTAAQATVAARTGASAVAGRTDDVAAAVAAAPVRPSQPVVDAAPRPAALPAAAPAIVPGAALPAASAASGAVPAQRSAHEQELATLLPQPDDSLFSTILGLGAAPADARAATADADDAFRALLATPPARAATPPSSSVLRGAAAAAAASAYRPASDGVLNPAAAVLAAEEAASSAPLAAAPATPGSPAAGRTLLELAAQAGEEAQPATVSTQSPSFASLMEGLSDAIGVDVSATACSGTVIGSSAVAASVEVVELPLDTVESTDGHDGSTAVGVTGPVVAGPVAVERAVDSDSRDDENAAVVVRAPAPTPVAGPAEQDDPTGAELARLGLPRHLRPVTVGQQLHTALRASLTRLPTAPPAVNRPGGVLAIVGPLALALHVAREVAAELGLPVATSVAVATSTPGTTEVPERQVLHGVAEAADRRATWRRRSNLTVVAVDAPLTATGAAEARAFLAALSPSATWGAVEATRKAQDVGAWTRALGGVHALALTDVEDTSDPAAVLELGIPVSRLGGRPATPRAWATLLTGRLAA